MKQAMFHLQIPNDRWLRVVRSHGRWRSVYGRGERALPQVRRGGVRSCTGRVCRPASAAALQGQSLFKVAT